MGALSNLVKVPDNEVRDWIKNEIQLTPYQEEKFRQLMRGQQRFYFYEDRPKSTVNLFFRLTIVFVPFYWLLSMVIFLPAKYLFTGNWGYSSSFYDKVHGRWFNKLGI